MLRTGVWGFNSTRTQITPWLWTAGNCGHTACSLRVKRKHNLLSCDLHTQNQKSSSVPNIISTMINQFWLFKICKPKFATLHVPDTSALNYITPEYKGDCQYFKPYLTIYWWKKQHVCFLLVINAIGFNERALW